MKLFHFFKAMWAAIRAYRRGVYFTARGDNAFWQLSLHSKYYPGLADFDLKDPENGSMYSRGNAHVWDKVKDGDDTYWKQRYVRNFDKDRVLSELVIVKRLLKKARPDLDHKDIYKLTEAYLKEQESVRCQDPDKSYQTGELLI